MSCKNKATCDFCDARCASYIFDFSEDLMDSDEKFEKEFLEWYDCGKPESNFEEIYEYENPERMLLSDWEPEDVIRGEDRRWSVWITKIFKIGERYFEVGYDHGLTELQEDEYWDTDVVEVRKEIIFEPKIIWKEIKK